jgi:type IV secretory pathway VirB2 component (pilin)
MAEEKILYRIVIDGKKATAKIIDLSNGVKKTDVAVEDLNQTLGQMNGEMIRTTSSVGRQMAALKRQRSQVQINSKEYQNLTKSMRFLQSQMDMSTGATGSASSAAMELGRVLSDAPYGIRGVANNLSQFASQMAFAAKSTGSLSLAFKDLWKALMGPLGILLAIQGVIAVFEKMSMSKKKVKEETDSLTQTFGLQTTKLMVLKSALDDSNASLEDKKDLVKKASKEFKDLNIEIDENGKLTDASRIAIDEYSVALVKNAKAKAIANLITKEMNKQAQLEVEETGEQLGYFDTLYHAISAKILGTSKAVSNALKEDGEKRDEAMKNSQDRVQKFLKALEENRLDMAKSLFSGKDKGTGTKDKPTILQTPKEFQTEAEDLQSEIDAWDKKMLMAATKNKDQRLQLELVFYKKSKEARRKDREDAAYNALFKYEDSLDALVKSGKMDANEAEKAKGIALVKTQEKVQGINDEHDKLIKKAEEATKALRLGLGGGDSDDEEKFSLEEGLKQYMKFQSAMTSFLGAEYDRQLTIEQNKTNALNNELNQRLLNENLSKDERERIQLQIGQNDEKLRKKQEAIEKKRFKLNKAANIAQATIATYLAANKVLVETKGGTVARFVAMAATISAGLLNVAAIARQKFQSSAGSGGSIGAAAGGNGEGESREFNFNLAGSTQSNQLTQSIASQLSQPIQTYVVSSEITSQQQLDLNIANTATIG